MLQPQDAEQRLTSRGPSLSLEPQDTLCTRQGEDSETLANFLEIKFREQKRDVVSLAEKMSLNIHALVPEERVLGGEALEVADRVFREGRRFLNGIFLNDWREDKGFEWPALMTVAQVSSCPAGLAWCKLKGGYGRGNGELLLNSFLRSFSHSCSAPTTLMNRPLPLQEVQVDWTPSVGGHAAWQLLGAQSGID